MKKKNRGFTLAEMLIVVAIIGILISIIFNSVSNVLERAREATDLANLREAYSELYNIVYLNEPLTNRFEKLSDGYRTYIRCKSKKQWWQTPGLTIVSNCVVIGEARAGAPTSNKSCIRLRYYASTNKFEFLAVEEVGSKTITYN